MSVLPEGLEHGGRLNQAARQWGIPRSDWLDLSTGISPYGYPVPTIPETVWQRLPEDDDGLDAVARDWLGLPAGAGCLPVAGSQAALQTLPALRSPCRVGVVAPAYAEHARAWQRGGHEVMLLTVDEVEKALTGLDVLVCVNPNNPTGTLLPAATLRRWHQQLATRGGWLVVDEAFLDASMGESLAADAHLTGLVVLRSLGKFFGLAGLRAGLMVADPALCHALQQALGPWAMSHPARYVMAQAIQDQAWQQQQCQRLREDRKRLDGLLGDAGLFPRGDSHLFAWCPGDQSQVYFEALAKQGVLVRYFAEPKALRFGLAGSELQWDRLRSTLSALA